MCQPSPTVVSGVPGLGLSLPYYTHLYRFSLENPGNCYFCPCFRAPSSLWEEKKERLALAKRFAGRQFGDFGNWEQARPALVAILPPLHSHSPPVWAHGPWLVEQGQTHFEGSDGWREEQGVRKEKRRGGREGRLRRRKESTDLSERKGGEKLTDLSEREPGGVRRSVSLHTRAGRERREKVTFKVGSEIRFFAKPEQSMTSDTSGDGSGLTHRTFLPCTP